MSNPSRRRRPRPRRAPGRRPFRPGGFTGHGLGTVYETILPGLHGPEKRRWFNQQARLIPAATALSAAVFGVLALGPLGGLLGLALGLSAGDALARKGRFRRD